MKKVSKLPFFKRGDSNEIVVQPICVKDFNNVPHVKVENLSDSQHFAQRKYLILTCTDVTETEFETFTAPDFNTLSEDIYAFILKPSNELKGADVDNNDYTFSLLFPYKNELGEELLSIKFQVPKVIHSQALAEITDSDEREEFMFRVVTGLSKKDVELMRLSDYLVLKAKVGAFFLRSADYFRLMTWTA